MIDLLSKELASYGVQIQSGNSCLYLGEPMHIEMCSRQLHAAIVGNKQMVSQLWQDLTKMIVADNQKNNGSSSLCPVFANALRSLYYLSASFQKLHEIGAVSALKTALSRDATTFSTTTLSKTIEFYLAIEWVDFLIRQDIYLRSLIRSYLRHNRERAIVARGPAGPWSNLDLPMQERVWEWSDQEEETSGRERDKQNQFRYTKGLENYGNGDYSFNADAGHYWRAINLEPYDFDDDSESLYPKREMLWL